MNSYAFSRTSSHTILRSKPFSISTGLSSHIAVKTRPQQQRWMRSTAAMSEQVDYKSIPTPATCYADFCLVPIGTGSVSVANEVASVQKVIRASGVKHTMHSAGTTLEGSWDDVFAAIGKATAVVHQSGVVRVQTSMRVGTRTDKSQTAEEKVKRVQDLLG